jgi:ABC-type glycerol-3-phosphate transport system substrate-binding protein
MSKFQIVLLGVFGFFIIVAVGTFALYRGGSGSQDANVMVWGTFTSEDFSTLLNNSGLAQDRSLVINYAEKRPDRIEAEFTEALAQGVGPDLIIFRQDQFWKNKEKLLPIPYSSIGERDFKETFVEAGEIYLQPEGIYAVPLIADPLVLYYNRDHLSAAGIAKPLGFWDEIFGSTVNLTKRDAAGNLTRSTVSLGETRNINNAKEILALLFLQAGTPVTGFDSTGDLNSYLGETFGLTTAPAESALEFFTQFSNPTKTFYSWNRTLPEAQTRFAAGDLSYYLGFASELRALRNKNPTLNFAVAPVPQSRVSGKVLTVSHLYSLSVSRGSRNPQAALTAAIRLVAGEVANAFSTITLLPPARRDLLSVKPTDSILPVFYTAALQAKSWIDPDASATKLIFSSMVEDVTSGRARTSESVSKAHRELDNLINQ